MYLESTTPQFIRITGRILHEMFKIWAWHPKVLQPHFPLPLFSNHRTFGTKMSITCRKTGLHSSYLNLFQENNWYHWHYYHPIKFSGLNYENYKPERDLIGTGSAMPNPLRTYALHNLLAKKDSRIKLRYFWRWHVDLLRTGMEGIQSWQWLYGCSIS